MKIVRNETVRTVAGIGAVAFEPIARANAYYRQHYGRTHQMAFRFEHNGREYWGEVIRHFDRKAAPGSRVAVETELRTRSGDHSRALAESHKIEWRAALVAEFKRELESFVAATDSTVASAAEVAADVDAMPVEPMAEPATDSPALPVDPRARVAANVAAIRDKLAPAPLARIASRTIDGTEWLGAFGWSADIRAAYVLTLADAEAVAKLETDKERVQPGNGRYSIAARPYNAPALYTLADYREAEAEAARLDSLYAECGE